MNIFHTVYDTVYYMQLKQGKIIQKQKMQELSSLFITHRINVMHALVKFHEYIPYSLGVIARTRLTIWNLVKEMDGWMFELFIDAQPQ